MDDFISWETGEIKDKFGNTKYYIEFGSNENSIIIRNIDGNIIDFRVSSNSFDNIEGNRTRKEIYRDWKYYEEIGY